MSSLKRLLVVHNLKTGQDIVHEFCETDFAFELVEGSPEPDTNGDLDIESKLFYRIDWIHFKTFFRIIQRKQLFILKPQAKSPPIK